MKTKKNLWVAVLISALLLTSIGFSQEMENKSYKMVELSYMLPKIGMEKAFVKAIKEHNNLYHKEGAYAAQLDYITTGKEAGWYVWGMGSTTFTDLDKRPGKGAHADDWDKKVSPLVTKNGRVEYWKMNEKLSYGTAAGKTKYETVWFLDIKRGDDFRFKAFMMKVKEAYIKKGGDVYYVYENQFREDDGRDVAIVWPINSWSDMDKDDGGIKKTYEEINGEGSWDNAMKEWTDYTVGMISQVWEIGVE
ncbi:MAG: hypothetical protein CVU08_02190 [Bacteroidetes bacterium HGW-Bacteroidetes-3]|jgi:hypothetical protein|nr:MAG: hypothetical protein CVU08_02190 [Bacteroidetes bacterium HGW-Bacteroidetes-3]